jgi:hypothetical protein
VEVALVVAGIRGLVRVGRAADQALLQHELDKAIEIPDLAKPGLQRIDVIRDELLATDESWRIDVGGPLAFYWDARLNAPDPQVARSEEVLYLAALETATLRKSRARGVAADRALEVGGARLIRQFGEGRGPVGPLTRFLVVLADATLEIVGAHPSLLGVGGNGERLVGALASNLATLIPDDADRWGPRSQFADRLLRIFLRASLQTLDANADVLLPSPLLGQLTRNFLAPVLAELPADLAEQSRWRDAVDALAGPAASAVLAEVAANPEAYLGREFDPDNAVGALTKALLEEASRHGLRGSFSDAGLLALYKSALGVAADRPELFVPGAGRTTDEVARALFQVVAGVLRDAPSPFNDDLGVELATAVVDVLRQRVGTLPGGEPWERLACTIVTQVVDGLASALASRDSRVIESALTRTQLLTLAKAVATQVARTPEMVGDGKPEVVALAGALAQAIALDGRRLLSAEDWLAIATTLADEVAANPQRLVPRAGPAAHSLAAALLTDLVAVANAEAAAHGREQGSVLFGATLREAMRIALRAGAGDAERADAQRIEIRALAGDLANWVRDHNRRYGSSEWLLLYRSLLPRVLAGDEIGQLDEQQVTRILEDA